MKFSRDFKITTMANEEKQGEKSGNNEKQARNAEVSWRRPNNKKKHKKRRRAISKL